MSDDDRASLAGEASVIEVDGLVKRFGGDGAVLFDGASLRVSCGEMLAVTGPSGCGKSTLIHLLAALERPTDGRIAVHGRDLRHRHDLNRYRRSEIGVVFQLHYLMPRLSARQNVELAMVATRVRGRERRRRAVEMLERLGLDGVHDRDPSRLSGGERQRVAIARALVNRPSIVLADEPTASLDAVAQGRVLDVLDELRRTEATTVVVVSHDPRTIDRATRVVEVRDQKLVARCG